MTDIGATGIDLPLAEYQRRAMRDDVWIYTRPLTLGPVTDRNEYLVARVAGRRIIHVGCATQAETQSQALAGRLLFQQLERSAAMQLGVDPDEVGMRALERLVGSKVPLQICFLSQIDQDVLARVAPELILIPETLEHVPDAGSLLRDARALALRFGAEVIVTVPNALSFVAISEWLRGRDYGHPDHVATYTPRTLQSVLEKSALRPLEIIPYSWGPPPRQISARQRLSTFLHATGSISARLRAVAEASMAHRFCDGWIARAVPTADDGTAA